MAFVYYGFGEHQAEYYARLRNVLPNGRFRNHELNNLRRLPREIVYDEINKAECGLCLSAAEGAMHASIEYLLCRIPVVSTLNCGGRDLFFDNRYCMTVEPDPRVIETAVREVVARNIPREEIRQTTIGLQARERERFFEFMDRIIEESGRRSDFRDKWKNVFVDKLLESKTVSSVIDELKANN